MLAVESAALQDTIVQWIGLSFECSGSYVTDSRTANHIYWYTMATDHCWILNVRDKYSVCLENLQGNSSDNLVALGRRKAYIYS